MHEQAKFQILPFFQSRPDRRIGIWVIGFVILGRCRKGEDEGRSEKYREEYAHETMLSLKIRKTKPQ
jgi:hypothetical protein